MTKSHVDKSVNKVSVNWEWNVNKSLINLKLFFLNNLLTDRSQNIKKLSIRLSS